MRTLSFVLIVPVLGIVTAMPQEPSAAQPYEEPDAYQIYSLLLPQEESYGFAKGTLIIQEETVASEAVVAACLDPEGQDVSNTQPPTMNMLGQRSGSYSGNQKSISLTRSSIARRLPASKRPTNLAQNLAGTSSCPPSVSTERKRWQSSIRAASAAAYVAAPSSICWKRFTASGEKCPASHA